MRRILPSLLFGSARRHVRMPGLPDPGPSDFWQSKYDFFESEISPTAIFLTDIINRMAYQHATLGPFSFPPTPEAPVNLSVSEGINSTTAEMPQAEDLEVVRD